MKKKARMGRPPLPEGKVRQVFAVRVSPAERTSIEKAAERAGLSISEWARITLMEAATRRP